MIILLVYNDAFVLPASPMDICKEILNKCHVIWVQVGQSWNLGKCHKTSQDMKK